MLKYKTAIETQSNRKSNDPDFIYLNVNIMNSAQGQKFYASNPQITYRVRLQYSIISNPDDYFFYISRFSCEAGVLLPIWSPEILDGQTDPNKCCQAITLSVVKNGTTYTQTTNMEYVPEDGNASPLGTNLYQDSSHYYYVYTYSHIVYLFNTMLTSCYNALQTQTGGVFTAAIPFMAYDSSTGLFSLYFDTTGEQFIVNFDSNLYNMFCSFYFRNTNQLVIDSNNGLNNVTVNGKTYTKVTQDFVSSSMWSPVETLVFTTSRLPIVPEQFTQPLAFNDSDNIVNITTSPQKYQKVITDISLPVDKSSDWRAFISYVPAFPRYINLSGGSGELKDIDISLFFQDKYNGQLIPVCLGNGGVVNIKLCFQKKN